MKQDAGSQIGQSNVEVALLLVMVAVVSMLILPVVGVRLDGVFCQVVGVFSANAGKGCALAPSVIFSDDFSKDSAGWSFLNGKWRLCDGRLCAGPSGEFRALAKGSNAKDYTVSVDALLNKGSGYGLFFRASGDKKINGYSFQYEPGSGKGQFIMRKWVNGAQVYPPIATAKPPANYQWTNTPRHVDLTVKGNTFTAKIDGQTVLVGKDATYSSGQAGLRVWSSQASFDNFKVTAP
ncbi:MAG: DUF1080 domain-containing protein [Chloroflexi bacterium]|nr:DUF1080 domain-containing protein [Chloroflexota bacterium]